MTHNDQVKILGEISGVDLEASGDDKKVFVYIGSKRILIIHDNGNPASHHVTRAGLGMLIDRQQSITARIIDLFFSWP